MQDVISLDARGRRGKRWRFLLSLARTLAPTWTEAALAAATLLLLVVSFPDFQLWPLAWVGLVPITLAIVRGPMSGARAFLLGWATGSIFFYATCYWLSHAIIHYGGFHPLIAHLMLLPGGVILGLFPAAWAFALARVSARRGASLALLLSPFAWAALEWARLGATGQLWNAIAYSQAFVPALIQPARWGGVYLVGFLIVSVNAGITFFILKRDRRSLVACAAVLASVAFVLFLGSLDNKTSTQTKPSAVVIGVQPNVAVDFERSISETTQLMERHLTLSTNALNNWERGAVETHTSEDTHSGNIVAEAPSDERRIPRVFIWPESPMNFRYTRDAGFREFVASFARTNRASVLFNALEPAPAGGLYNSAVMVNEEGRLVAQYDKIRLLPFGEYVPLPRWLPPAWLLEGIAGDFTAGADYPLMPLGDARTGVFICFESAFPSIARRFAADGADVLVNISNDGYLGRTPVIRQHLANVVFRAVETGRPVLRVTNTGVSALITPRGEVRDATAPFEQAARTWTVGRAGSKTFYTSQGDLFAALCAAVGALVVISTFRLRRRRAS